MILIVIAILIHSFISMSAISSSGRLKSTSISIASQYLSFFVSISTVPKIKHNRISIQTITGSIILNFSGAVHDN